MTANTINTKWFETAYGYAPRGSRPIWNFRVTDVSGAKRNWLAPKRMTYTEARKAVLAANRDAVEIEVLAA